MFRLLTANAEESLSDKNFVHGLEAALFTERYRLPLSYLSWSLWFPSSSPSSSSYVFFLLSFPDRSHYSPRILHAPESFDAFQHIVEPCWRMDLSFHVRHCCCLRPVWFTGTCCDQPAAPSVCWQTWQALCSLNTAAIWCSSVCCRQCHELQTVVESRMQLCFDLRTWAWAAFRVFGMIVAAVHPCPG